MKFDEEKRDERIHFFRLLTFTAGILFFEGKGEGLEVDIILKRDGRGNT